jgi:hypothetical protein
MSLFPVKITRTQKPPLGVGIDWNNPLAQGLVGAYPINENGGTTIFDNVGSKHGLKASNLIWKSGNLENSIFQNNGHIDIPWTKPAVTQPWSIFFELSLLVAMANATYSGLVSVCRFSHGV